MSEGLFQIIHYINSIVYYVMIHYAFTRVFQMKAKIKWIFLTYLAFLIISSQLFLVFNVVWINITISIISLFVISFLYFGAMGTKLFFAAVLYFILAIGDTISFLLINYMYYDIFGVNLSMEIAGTIGRTTSNIFVLPLLLIYIVIFRKKFMNQTGHKYIKIPKSYTISAVFILAGIIVINTLLIYLNIYDLQSVVHIMLMLQFIIIVITFLVVWFYEAALEKIAVIEKSRIKEQMLQGLRSQYQLALDHQKTMSEFNHNLRYQYITLSGLLENQEIDKAKKYMADKIGEVDFEKSSGDITIDAMINHYKQRIREKLNMALKIRIPIIAGLKIEEELLASTIGNALENAIDACLHLEEQKREIAISMSVTSDQGLFINIKNPYRIKPVIEKGGKFATTKAEKSSHGFGLSSIYESIPAHVGQISIKYDEDIFDFSVLFYNAFK